MTLMPQVVRETVPPTVTPRPTEVLRPTEVPSSTPTVVSSGLSPKWDANIRQWSALIMRYANAYDIDPNLIAAVMYVESKGIASARSYAGATGLMQVMPRETGFPSRPTVAQLLDPSINIDWGCRILSSELKWANGNLVLALGAYYDGRARSLAGLARTRAYADKVLGYYNYSKR